MTVNSVSIHTSNGRANLLKRYVVVGREIGVGTGRDELITVAAALTLALRQPLLDVHLLVHTVQIDVRVVALRPGLCLDADVAEQADELLVDASLLDLRQAALLEVIAERQKVTG